MQFQFWSIIFWKSKEIGKSSMGKWSEIKCSVRTCSVRTSNSLGPLVLDPNNYWQLLTIIEQLLTIVDSTIPRIILMMTIEWYKLQQCWLKEHYCCHLYHTTYFVIKRTKFQRIIQETVINKNNEIPSNNNHTLCRYYRNIIKMNMIITASWCE